MISIDTTPGSTIAVQVTPKSSKNQIEGWVEDAQGSRWLKVRLTTAPEDGKANAALIKLLSNELNISPSRLQIASGEKSKKKRITFI